MCVTTSRLAKKNGKAKKPRIPSSKFSPSLRSALINKKWDDAIVIITASPDEVKKEDRAGDLPLHIACDVGAPFNIIQQLIREHKPALQKRGFCGRLPLHYAAYSKPSVNVIKLLLRHYPEGSTILDEDGRLPLHLAVIRNAPKQAIAALIEAHPRALGTPNKFGNCPSDLARNEHVASILEVEKNRPRGIKAKMAIESKMNAVWNDPKQNPMGLSSSSSSSNKKKSNRASSNKVTSMAKAKVMAKAKAKASDKSGGAEKKKSPNKNHKISSYGRTLKEHSHNRKHKPVPRVDIMIAQNSQKSNIPTPEKVDVRGSKTVMSNYRQKLELPSPVAVAIDAIEKHWK